MPFKNGTGKGKGDGKNRSKDSKEGKGKQRSDAAQKSRGGKRETRVCHYCVNTEHLRAQCRKKIKDRGRATAAVTDSAGAARRIASQKLVGLTVGGVPLNV